MRKLLSVLLVMTMIAGMTMVASAKTITKGITNIDGQQFQDTMENAAQSGMVTLNDVALSSMDDLADMTVNPGSIIKIVLPAAAFTDASGARVGNVTDTVSSAALRTGKITMRSTSRSNDVAEITLASDKNASYIKIEFDKTPTIKSTKFNYNIYLSVKGVRKTETLMNVQGVLEAAVVEIDDDYDYYDLSKGDVIKPVSSIRDIELYLGEYVTLKRSLQRNRKYSGIATTEVLAQDEHLFDKNPNLVYLYRLQTVNLKTTGNIISFDMDERYYVYNTNGTYLGTTDQKLPYWTRYYLTDKKVSSIKIK